MEQPTPEQLRELLDYEPETGALTWKPRTGKGSGTFNLQHAGGPAGTLRPDGYVAVKIRATIYAAHRVIWAMVHGRWPECVRHRNRNDADNRLANLCEATRSAITSERLARFYPKVDADGRRYRLESLAALGRQRPELTYELLGVQGTWRWSRERMQEALEAGLIVQGRPGAAPRFKRYCKSQQKGPHHRGGGESMEGARPLGVTRATGCATRARA